MPEKKRRRSFGILDLIAWIAFIIFIIYAILRVTGAIHSPDWIAVLLLGVFLGRYAMKIDTIKKDTDKITEYVEDVKPVITKITDNCGLFNKKE